MSDQSTPSDSPDEPVVAINSISGGVDVDAEQVNIDGDVVGRDKITQNTWTNIRQIMLKPWAWIGGIALLVIGLIVVAGLFNITSLRALLPTPTPASTPLAFAPASAGEVLIIVADFEDRSSGRAAGIDPDQYVFDELQDRIERDHLGVRLQHLRQAVDDNTVRSVGQVYSATLIVWGWYDAWQVSLRLERLQLRAAYYSSAEGQPIRLAEPTQVKFDVITDLQSQAAYLALFTLGVEQYTAGQDNLALPYFNSALAAMPQTTSSSTNPAEAYFFRGNAYYHRADYVRARADFSETLRLQPDNALAYNNRANASDLLGDHLLALADYDRAIDSQSDAPDLYLNRGICHMNLGQTDAALADLNQALALQPDFVDAYLARATVYSLHLGEPDHAIADYTRAIELQPNLTLAYTGRAMAYELTGEAALAQADLTTTARLGLAESVGNDFARGQLYFVQRDFDRAIAAFDRSIQSVRNNPVAYYYRGQAYRFQGKLDPAIADFSAAIQLKPDFVDARYYRGACYSLKLNFEQALADYNAVIELDATYAMAYVGRSVVYVGRQETDKAIADLNKALDLSQNDPLLKQQIEEMLKVYRSN